MIQRKINQFRNYWSLQFDLYRSYILRLPPKSAPSAVPPGETVLSDGRILITYGRATAAQRRGASAQPSPSIYDLK